MSGRIKNPERLGLKLAKEAARTGRCPLLVLPSTEAAFRMLDAYREGGLQLSAAGNPGLAASWGVRAESYLTTPRPLWAALKGQGKLPWAVAVFEDQLVAIDDSYLRVEVDDQSYMVSPLLMMLLVKFRPTTYIASMTPRHRGGGDLRLAPYSPDVPPALSQQVANEIMGRVLRPLLDSTDDVRMPWLARPSFALKRNNNFHRILVQQIQEMETLVRLCRATRPIPEVPVGWLGALRAIRLEISKPLQ